MPRISTLVLSLTLMAAATFLNAGQTVPSQKAYEKMQSLAGDWEANAEGGGVIRLSYKLMSSNTILVETYRTPSGKETLTIYHMDGGHFMATHYCAQGNQPRLRFQAASSAPDHLVFQFLDATNLPSKSKAHMTHLEVTFVDPDHFDQLTTYEAGKEKETTTLKFVRDSRTP